VDPAGARIGAARAGAGSRGMTAPAQTATAEAAAAAPQPRGIFSPLADFLLLGGASLVLFPLAMVVFPSGRAETWHIGAGVLVLVFMLNYVLNFPHFTYSYQLLYANFRDKVAGRLDPALRWRFIFSGIVVPVAMVLFFVVACMQQDTRLLRFLPNLMFLTAGWHYAKQGFGMLIATSVYKRVFYTPVERKLLLFNAHLVWIYAWIMFNTGAQDKVYLGIHFSTLGLPPALQATLGAALVLGFVSLPVALGMKYMRERRMPPVSGMTAYIASTYLWIILRFGMGSNHPIHPVVMLIPAMHSLQYIALVLKMRANESRKGVHSWRGFWGFTGLGILTGALAFMAVPRLLDAHLAYDKAVFGPTMFMFLFWIFINIHHYFIDNVIWRRENSETKAYLFTPE